jgi:hypothetical protein
MPVAKIPYAKWNDYFYGWSQKTRSRVRPQILHTGPFGTLTFTFPYAPREVSYSRLAGTYAEIERPGQYPILDRSANQLMQVSLQFRVADPLNFKPNGEWGGSGGLSSIEGQLDKLRQMALFPGRILVSQMDAFLSRPIAPTGEIRQGGRVAKFAAFRMTDLSIDVVYRNLSNAATQADVSMTLVEDRNPFVFASVLPKIDYSDTPQNRAAAAAAGGAANPEPGPRNPWSSLVEKYGGQVDDQV